MWTYDLSIHPKKPIYLIRAKIVFSGAKNLEDFYKKLGKMRTKLEMTLPGSFKAKYIAGMDGLLVTVTTSSMSDCHRAMYQMDDYIKAASLVVK